MPEMVAMTGDDQWRDANQRHLAVALAAVRSHLRRHADRVRGDTGTSPPDEPLESGDSGAWPAAAPPPALEAVCAGFRLSPFERDVVLLCAGVELDARFAPLCAEAQRDPQRAYPTFGLALAALPGAHWSALSPAGPLRHWKLVEVAPGSATASPLTAGALRADERVLHYLAGVGHLDERLAGIFDPVVDTGGMGDPLAALPPSQQEVAARVVGIWTRAPQIVGERPPVIQLCGPDSPGRRAVAAAACAALGLRLCGVRAAALPTTPTELESVLRLWEREALLAGSALLLDCDRWDASGGGGNVDPARAEALSRAVERIGGYLIVTARDRLAPAAEAARTVITLEVRRPDAPEQRELWRAYLGTKAAGVLNGHVAELASQFDVGARTIRAACAEALGAEAATVNPDTDTLGRALWESCRMQARPRLDDLAQRVESSAGWDDLILPDTQKQVLRDIGAHVRRRAIVYEEWGFAGRGARGLGISALFSGTSGTGKTMAAEVVARELALDLYRIDLSSVVSKYIGETEKNLARIFDAAEEGGAILLFDEADALFGKRSEVKDSHDRYANVEVSYLLQRMESYRGLAILTTNLKNNIDTAFLRRIRFVVQFPFPDAAQRAAIWTRAFPQRAPTEGLRPVDLARLNVAGGNIKNIALNAAFLAADAGEPVRMTHLLRAAQAEYAKLERPLTEAETAGWV